MSTRSTHPKLVTLSCLAALSLLSTAPLHGQKLGSRLTVSTQGDVSYSDAAYSTIGSEYLLIWHRDFGGTSQIYGRRMNSIGGFVGSSFAIATGSSARSRPTVAYVDKTGRWLVAWQEKVGDLWQIRGRSVRPSNGAMSSIVVLASSSVDQIEPELAGDKANDDDAILVWRSGDAGIRARQIQVSASGNPIVGSAKIVSLYSGDQRPRICTSGGDKRRYVVVWERRRGFFSSDVYARALDGNGIPKGAELGVATGITDDRHPSIDGDGETFAVAWQRREGGPSFEFDIYARMLQHNGSKVSLGGPIRTIKSDANVDQTLPVVAHLRDKYCIAWVEESGTNHDNIRFRLYCPESLAVCSTLQIVTGTNDKETRPAVVSRWVNGSNSDRGLLLYTSDDPDKSYVGDLNAQRIEAVGLGGRLHDFGGSCGLGGTLGAIGAFAIGNRNFWLRVDGASPASPFAIVNIAASGPPLLNCGTCAITNPTILLAVPLSGGSANFALPIPCLYELYGNGIQFQCFVPTSGVTPCVGIDGMSFSNRLSGFVGQ